MTGSFAYRRTALPSTPRMSSRPATFQIEQRHPLPCRAHGQAAHQDPHRADANDDVSPAGRRGELARQHTARTEHQKVRAGRDAHEMKQDERSRPDVVDARSRARRERMMSSAAIVSATAIAGGGTGDCRSAPVAPTTNATPNQMKTTSRTIKNPYRATKCYRV